ncbi:MAG TPA: uroporphyrinogen decarboxylase family protein [Bryobacteraceae bacterium]|nr:uroporphyrinogen decarboxylase family protein [Bryobacteraceae bacterium]
MFTRRAFLFTTAATAARGDMKLTARERVDRALQGQDVDRVPFTYWYHFGLEKEPPARFAQATLDFHKRLRTDLVKVMSDFPYPSDASVVHENPFPAQIRALAMIREGLGGEAHFVETIFNPWNVAEKLTSKDEVQRLRRDEPQKLTGMLERIGRSEANHARRAVRTGASGVFLAIANAQHGILTPEEYRKFSEPFDRMVLDAVSSAPLNILHLHGDKVYLHAFTSRHWPVAAINYSIHGTGVSIADFRTRFDRVIMAGLDEVNFRKLTRGDLLKQTKAAREAAGKRFILAPGCSVPNDTTDEELLRLNRALGVRN